MSRLNDVIKHLDAYDAIAALDAALTQWAEAPSESLEPIVVEIARLAHGTVDPLAQRPEDKPHDAWLALAAELNSAQLTWLLDAFLTNIVGLYSGARRKKACQQLRALCSFRPDPRLAKLAQVHLESGLAQDDDVQLALAALLIAAKAPRALSVLESHEGLSRQARPAFDRLLNQAVDRPEVPIDRDEVVRVRGAITRFSQRPVSPGGQSLDALFDTVCAALDDDGPRHVLADAMLEAGDPRGEFISLHLNANKQAAARKALQKVRGGWLAPWSHFIATDHVDFERGLPSSAVFIDSPRVDSMMRTLRSVTVACDDARFLLKPELANVRTVEATVEAMVRVLDSAKGSTVPWVSMALSSGADHSTQRLFELLIAGRAPRLERLVLDGVGDAAGLKAAELIRAFRGTADLTFATPLACGAVVAAAVREASAATVKFSCRSASIRGEAMSGSMVLRVSSSTPAAEQRTFVDQLPERIAKVELSVEGDGPSPFDRLRHG